MVKKLLFVAAAALYGGMSLCAVNLNDRLEAVLRGREFDGASVSILAVTSGGDTLLCHDSHRQLIPASNMKLVTTALALHSLGGDYRYETALGYSGEIREGILHGDLYIIGGGDPTLGSKKRLGTSATTLFSQWKQILTEAGIHSIDGYIIGDGRCFPGMMEQESWQLNDCGTYYGTGVSGLSFYENVIDFSVAPGTKVGSELVIKPTYPNLPWMTYSYACLTGKPDTGNSLYFYTSNFAPFGEMRGTLAINRKALTEHAANKFPEYTMAYYFAEYLHAAGIECEEGPADLGHIFAPEGVDISPAAELTILGSTTSAPLSQIVRSTNYDSNNFYAESLLKTLGKEYCGKGCYDSSYVAVSGLLKEIGIKSTRESIRDGSGLSRENHVSAAFMCALLKSMMRSPAYTDFLNSLPSPGTESTLKTTLQSAPEATRSRIRMKSGTMTGVRCFSGYILPATSTSNPTTSNATASTATASNATASNPTASTGAPNASASPAGETIIFSILINNYSVPTATLQKKINDILLLLAD